MDSVKIEGGIVLKLKGSQEMKCHFPRKMKCYVKFLFLFFGSGSEKLKRREYLFG